MADISEKMREEFEEVFKAKLRAGGYEETGFTIALWRDSDDRYESAVTAATWWGWQQSRVALVVELPKRCLPEGYDYAEASQYEYSVQYSKGVDETIDEVRKALEAAGVRVKP